MLYGFGVVTYSVVTAGAVVSSASLTLVLVEGLESFVALLSLVVVVLVVELESLSASSVVWRAVLSVSCICVVDVASVVEIGLAVVVVVVVVVG